MIIRIINHKKRATRPFIVQGSKKNVFSLSTIDPNMPFGNTNMTYLDIFTQNTLLTKAKAHFILKKNTKILSPLSFSRYYTHIHLTSSTISPSNTSSFHSQTIIHHSFFLPNNHGCTLFPSPTTMILQTTKNTGADERRYCFNSSPTRIQQTTIQQLDTTVLNITSSYFRQTPSFRHVRVFVLSLFSLFFISMFVLSSY